MKKRITISIVIAMSMSLAFGISPSSAQLNDISGHQYEDAILYVADQGIVKGYADGSYQPDRILNRAEFTKIIMSARFSKSQIESCMGSPGFYKNPVFSDIEAGIWFEPHSCLAKKENIIGGFPDGTFKGTQPIIFAEAAKISINSYGLRSGNAEPWYAPFIEKLSGIDAIPDTLSAISDPTQRAIKEITRGEMADIIYRLRVIQDTVSSSDGSFSIKIPEISLPEGIDRSAISINKLAASESPIEEVNGAPMVFYHLEPDGLVFEEPISFEVSTATQANTIPIVFLVSANNFEMIPDPIIEIDQETKIASLSGKISHFSEIAIANIDLFETTIETPKTQYVGGDYTFLPTVNVLRTNKSNTFDLVNQNTSITILDSWTLRNGFFNVISGDISPHTIFDTPKNINLSGEQRYPAQGGGFRCDAETDQAVIKYQVELVLDYEKTTPSGTRKEKLSGTMITAQTEPFACSGIPDSLLLYLPMDSAGTTQADQSTYGNDGTVFGATYQSSCKSGGCFLFDGVDDYIRLPDITNKLEQGTISMWVKLLNWPGEDEPIFLWSSADDNNKNYMGLGKSAEPVPNYGPNDDLLFGVYDPNLIYGTDWKWSPGPTPVTNTWFHVVGIWGNRLELYIDGKLVGAAPGYVEIGSTHNRIGSGADGNSFANALIDEVKVFNRVLSGVEVLEEFNNGSIME